MRFAYLLLALMLASGGFADTLTLRNGRVVNGTYAGGTARQIRMEIGNQVQDFDVSEVSSLSFAERSATASDRANIVQAVVRNGATSLQLPPGRMYLYGMTTGGAAPSSPFASGQYAQAMDDAGQLAASLAYGTNDRNSYTTQTGFHVVGGVSVAGSWDTFSSFHGSNQQRGASSASVTFTIPEDSLVVVIALASSQQDIKLQGLPGLQTDASSNGPGTVAMTIAHADLPAGTYTAREASRATVGGQEPSHMADLVGVFAFGYKPGASPAVDVGQPRVTPGATNRAPISTPAKESPAIAAPGGVLRGDIHRVDFRNFDYPSGCQNEMSEDFDSVIHVSKGEWRKEANGGIFFGIGSVAYADLNGDGQDEAVVSTFCRAVVNVSYNEIFVFETSSGSPKLLAKLAPPDWGGSFEIADVQVGKKQLAITYPEGGSHAQPDWLVTARFQWDGSRFVRVASDRKPFTGWPRR